MATNTVSRIPFSASTQGMGVLVVATATAGTLIHTTGTSATVQDEIRLYLSNIHTSEVLVSIEYGDATATRVINVPVPAKSGLVQALPDADLILTGSGTVAATLKIFAATTNVITAYGSVFRLTP